LPTVFGYQHSKASATIRANHRGQPALCVFCFETLGKNKQQHCHNIVSVHVAYGVPSLYRFRVWVEAFAD
jgi:hypothetical protein